MSLSIFAAVLSSCGGSKPTPPVPPPAPADQGSGLPVLGTAPDFALLDQDGRDFRSVDLLGKVWLADFVFTKCTGVCVQMTSTMGRVQDLMAAHEDWKDLQLVSFSVDPDADRPAELAAYAKKNEADGARWKFLTGTRSAIWRLSKEGMKLPVGDDAPGGAGTPIFHSQKFVLVDRDGRIRGYYDALTDPELDKVVKDIGLLMPEKPAEKVTPIGTVDVRWLKPRERLQLAEAAKMTAFHDFKFTDRLAESGITFREHVVDDAARDFKANHYDHGTGLAVADVDKDSRLDLFFVNQLGQSELWKNLGGGRFEDMTAASGIDQHGRTGVAAAFADIDNDGDPDLFMTTVRGGNLLFENDGLGHFTDIAAKAGVGYVGHSAGSVFFDYDRDGLLDLWVSNVGIYTTDKQGRGGYYIGVEDGFASHLKPERKDSSILYRNMGGNVFKDVTLECGVMDFSWNGDVTPVDVNDDGFLDLYVMSMQGPDEYYENVGGKKFVEKSREVFPATPFGTMSGKVFDFDGDGDLDLYVTDMHTDMAPGNGMPPDKEKEKIPEKEMFPKSFLNTSAPLVLGNALYRNDGNGHFEEVSGPMGAETYWPWGPSVGDLNADGYDDVFVTAGMSHPFRYGVNSLLLNQGGTKFADAEFILGVEPRSGGRTAMPWFDLDCGGADKGHKFAPKDYTGRAVVWAALSTRSSAIFDIDDDGDLDIVTGEWNAMPQVLVSDLSSKKTVHFLKVRLTGTKSNRSASPGPSPTATGSAHASPSRSAAGKSSRPTMASRDTCPRAPCRCTSGWAKRTTRTRSKSRGLPG
ncbi:MAG: FG-GAP-like repeat-containing protein [Planctomycetes bacterium]|nr:FG-GAP-like repeat-containing protein [Planctomycetota bacterium]